MPQQDYLHVTLVSDRSGSMQTIRSDAEGSINAFVTEQAALPGICTFLFVEFNDINHRVFGPDDIKRCPPYRLDPNGGTAMLDAIGDAIVDTDDMIDALSSTQQPEKVIVVIVTDGQENQSTQYTYETVGKMIKTRKEKGWEFVFLAANQDAIMSGERLNIQRSTTYAATGASTRSVYGSFTQSVSNMRSKGAGGQSMSNMSVEMPTEIDADGNPIWAEEEEET